MTENKRYTTDNGSNEDVCLVDNVTGKEFESDFDEIVDLLNEQDERIKELETRNKRQYERLKNIGDLMFKRDWETLGLIVDKWEKEEEQLRKYGG